MMMGRPWSTRMGGMGRGIVCTRASHASANTDAKTYDTNNGRASSEASSNRSVVSKLECSGRDTGHLVGEYLLWDVGGASSCTRAAFGPACRAARIASFTPLPTMRFATLLIVLVLAPASGAQRESSSCAPA